MKLIAIRLTVAWLVLHTTCPSVYGCGLRHPSSSVVDDVASDGSICEDNDHEHRVLLPRATPKPTPCPTGGKTEVWIGFHSWKSNGYEFNQAKIWVISSDPNKHSVGSWKDFDKTVKVPTFYKGGNKACAKFYTIGASGDKGKNLVGEVNRESDYITPLTKGQRPVSSDIDPAALRMKADEAIRIMNSNFANTELEYEMYLREKWYIDGYGWNQFSPSGFISGLLSYLFPEFSYKSQYNDDPRGLAFGWYKPVPKTFFNTEYKPASTSAKDILEVKIKVKNEVYKAQPCTTRSTELWVGRHPITTDPTQLRDHEKLWVISSDPQQHVLPGTGIVWNDLRRDWVPVGFNGDKNCAKFFSIGVFDLENGIGGINYEEDYKNPLEGPNAVRRGVDPFTIKTSVEQANRKLFETFSKTSLKHTTFPTDENRWDFGWNEFNSNGYIHGLLRYLFPKSSSSEISPAAGTLPFPGWGKVIPVELFQRIYDTDDKLKPVFKIKDNIFETSVAADPMSLTLTLDP